MTRVLVVDDEAPLRFALRELLEDRGHQVAEAANGREALAAELAFDAVITDLAMPGMSGLELLEQLGRERPGLPVIVLTARGSERAAVQALRAGAWDYLTKPFDIDAVCAAVDRALEVANARRQARERAAERATGGRIIGESPAFRRLLSQVERLAPRDVAVLVRGETGTGKELIAALLHAGSARADKPLVRFNCAALPAELAESELFGHVRGAFTGAASDRPGYFRRADGGTLLLDEIAELPLPLQPKLLRALQEGEVQPVGGDTGLVDVRVVAATHRNLRDEVDAGRFREDVYYRLAVVEIELPPLRERRDDIPLLAEELARRAAERFDLPHTPLPERLLERFVAHDWPGNVRELENAVTRLLALSTEGVIDAESWRPDAAGSAAAPGGGSLRDQVAAFERGLIETTLRDTGGNRSEAARRLKVTRTTLLDKLKKHGLRDA